ncbi:protein Shroom1 [Pyxicephalus adspersus]|uniref:protein Shroom1 n=1 Tax=Pyxicephalus adspersus TaxID=30357 RepID=UPI003B5C96FA
MSSFSKAIDEWSTKSTSGISALRHQLISGDFPARLTPVNAMAAIVDSAYSSLSGSSYVGDYQTSCKHDVCPLNNEQISYIDSEYVKAIYNPSVKEQNSLRQQMHCEGSKADADISPGDHFNHKTNGSPTSNSSICLPEDKTSQCQGNSSPWVKVSVQNKPIQPCALSGNMEGNHQLNFPSLKFLPLSENMMALDEVKNSYDEKYYSSLTDKSRDCFQQMDNHTGKPFSQETEEHSHNDNFDSFVDNPQKVGKTSKSTRRSWNEFVSEKLRGYKKKAGSWKPARERNCNEGTKGEDVEKQALNQQQKDQYQPTQNMTDIECVRLEKCDLVYKSPHTRTSQTVYGVHSDDFCEQHLQLPNCIYLHDIPKGHNLKKDATIKSIPLLSEKESGHQSSNFCDLPSIKITKVSTPMLYHLAGGNSSLAMLDTSKQTRQLDASKEPDTFQTKGPFSASLTAEPLRPLHKTKSQSQLDENNRNELIDTTGGLTSSAEESFMLDYREKLKIAQKKVLRETSFKRRDLQMSLPVRIKLNPPKRPSIDHLGSYSSSNPNQEAKITQQNLSTDKGHQKDESEKATVSRIGGRKRLTKEQKKLCYSEPEKLDHLGIHNSGLAWNKDGSAQNKSGDHYRMKSLDKEQTLSSSNILKTDLKQIQHNALVDYMERKANRRPSSIHHVQNTSASQSFPEWKGITNETSCGDDSLLYHHRTLAGFSSSYDATVTWNGKYPMMSSVGEHEHSVDTMEEKATYFDRCSLDNCKGYSKESICQERLKSSVENMPFTTSALQSNVSKSSLETTDEDLLGYDMEVRADVNDLCGSSVIGESTVFTAEDQDTEAVIKHTKCSDLDSMSSMHQEELEPSPFSQMIGIRTISSKGYNEHSQFNIFTKQEIDASLQDKDVAREDLTGITSKLSAEERCAELVKEIVSKDKSLVDIIKPLPVRTSAISLLKSLFQVDMTVLEKCRNKGLKKDEVNVEGMSKSHSKTTLLLQRKYKECLNEITSKKIELMSNINSQLEVLFAQRESLLSEISDNTTHGTNLEAIAKEVCKPNEYERYLMFIGDLEKVVSLLFCLTIRLARVENALSRTDENTDADEMQSLRERHSLLSRQREDAKDLKHNLDRREQVVTGILAKYLNKAQLEDHKHYVRLKTSFLIEQKDLEEKIKFYEEQLESIHNSIPS